MREYDVIRADVQNSSERERNSFINEFVEYVVGLPKGMPLSPGYPRSLDNLPPGIRFLSGLVRDRVISAPTHGKKIKPSITIAKEDVARRHEIGELGFTIQRSASITLLTTVAAAAGYEAIGETLKDDFGIPPMSDILVNNAIGEAVRQQDPRDFSLPPTRTPQRRRPN